MDRIWTRATWIALGLAAGYCVLLLVGAATLPVYGWSSQSVSAEGSEPVETTSGTSTLLEVNGPWALLVVAVPLVVTLVVGALLMRATGRVGVAIACVLTFLYAGFCVLALMSIGIFLVPVAMLLVVACATSRLPARVQLVEA